jgi:hypothetical protein
MYIQTTTTIAFCASLMVAFSATMQSLILSIQVNAAHQVSLSAQTNTATIRRIA